MNEALLRISNWLPFTLLLFVALAYLPGRWLIRPFQSAFCGTVRQAAALLIGWAFYTFFADFTLKWFGPTNVGFYFAPGLLVWTCAAAVRFFGDEPAVCEATTRVQATPRQLLFACLFGLVCVLQIVPIEIFNGIYWGTPEIDWRSRLAVTNAIARDGLPAANPFFNPEGTSKLFFYYGFFLLPAACIHPTFEGGSGWDTVGVMAACVFLLGTIVSLFAIALGNAAVGDRKGGWVSGLLCFVTGLDLLPVLTLTLRGTAPSSIEWWNPAQITAVTAFPVWVPHHTLATLEVILAHVLAWQMDVARPREPAAQARPRQFATSTLACAAGSVQLVFLVAVLLAAAAMTSTYVAMLGYFSIFLHGLLKARRERSWEAGMPTMLATVVGGLMVLPFYYQLSKLDEYKGPSIQPILRPCPSEEPIRDAVAATLGVSPPIALFLTRLGGLVPQYFFELGFLFFVLLFWKRTGVGPRDPDGLWNRLGVMIVVAFVVGSIFVSVRTWNCDLNWRIMHPVQIALLGAAAAFWRDWRSKPRPLVDKIGLWAFIIIGIAGTGYDLVRSRLDYLRQPEMGAKGRTAADAARWIVVNVPSDARFAVDPRTFGGVGNDFFQHLLRRQFVISDVSFNAFPYGPDKAKVEEVAAEMIEAFTAKTTADRRRAILDRYNTSHVLIDERSELYDLDVLATFGEYFRVVQNPGATWKIVQWKAGTND